MGSLPDGREGRSGEQQAGPPPHARAPDGKTLDDLAVGMTASLTKTYSEWDILTFAA